MARTKRKKKQADIPGSFYQRNGRWWWKVQLPGDKEPKAFALKPYGSKFAATDLQVAREVARNLYQQAIFKSDKSPSIDSVTNVGELFKAYLEYAKTYYRNPEGKVTSEPANISYAMELVVQYYGNLSLDEFGPLKLLELRERMIQKDWSRPTINRRVGMIKRTFRWGVSRQIVSPVIYQGLDSVEGLRRGRTAARETKKRKPVQEAHVNAVLPFTTPVVSTMIELQLLTGMRPGELCQIRPCDIDQTTAVWHYSPQCHKNQFRDISRIISIGPRGQHLLRPYLLRPAEDYCFSPAESERQRRKMLTENRKTPLSCGNTIGSNRKEAPQYTPGEKYDSKSYRKAVRYAITAARKVIREAGGDPDNQQPYWTPYQLRHTTATKVRKEMGYECAGATLGHTNMSATAIYAERNQGLADEAAKRFG
jgi:integrase